MTPASTPTASPPKCSGTTATRDRPRITILTSFRSTGPTSWTWAPIRRPIPLDGSAVTDAAEVEWRVVESDRPDAEYMTQYREATAEEWADRYIFDATPRKLGYFEATCNHLATAPESTRRARIGLRTSAWVGVRRSRSGVEWSRSETP